MNAMSHLTFKSENHHWLDFAQKNYTAKKSLSHKETAYPRGRDGDSHSPVLGSSHRIVAWYSSLVSQ